MPLQDCLSGSDPVEPNGNDAHRLLVRCWLTLNLMLSIYAHVICLPYNITLSQGISFTSCQGSLHGLGTTALLCFGYGALWVAKLQSLNPKP